MKSEIKRQLKYFNERYEEVKCSHKTQVLKLGDLKN